MMNTEDVLALTVLNARLQRTILMLEAKINELEGEKTNDQDVNGQVHGSEQ